MGNGYVVVMGSYVADVAFRAEKLPAWGEAYTGSEFKLVPGGKGSNQAVAAAHAGAKGKLHQQTDVQAISGCRCF